MNTINFFKKHLVAIIIITFLIGSVIIGFYQGRNEIKKEKEELFSPEEEIENDDSKFSSSRTKRETEKPKFAITESRFDQIKTYVFSETDDKTLLPNDLSEQEKNEIKEIRKCRKQTLGFLEKDKDEINEKNKECDNFKNQLQPLYPQIETLKNQLTPLEQDKENKIKQRDNLRNIGSNWENHPQNSELTQINKEISSLVGQISHLNSQIKKLEATQEMYEGMLSGAENFKKMLEEQYEDVQKQYKDNILSELNSLYQITSAEG
ncbi:hypothetical protein [Italian clover phyllody phytoplasma]|uniref:hypothetical protein n=1 Tax=Italian clover phyllody phytoplasma TaxID=1196420 RepID=UPI0002EC64BA|nr:hypothetical protein [Italian clover phyllody phytoplasma]